jgi:hypothetical protein
LRRCIVKNEDDRRCDQNRRDVCDDNFALKVLQLGQGQVHDERYQKKEETDTSAKGVETSNSFVETFL